MSPLHVLMPLADGVEEMEAVILADVFRRAGWTVTLAGLRAGPVTASRGVRLLPDATWADAADKPCDLLALPGGGPGTLALAADARVTGRVRAQVAAGRPVAAICAAARVLDRAGVLRARRYTCFPGVQSELSEGEWVDAPVVVDGPLHTSQGPGTAFAFALHLTAALESPDRAERLRRELLLPAGPPGGQAAIRG
jgi:4-methyl-5(b-hydroxyethyl)-thiazole monophosphate biosynthesis